MNIGTIDSDSDPKNRVYIRFYEELNDFIESRLRKSDIALSYTVPRSVKDLIESLGVPHVEVDLILVNGESVDFDYLISSGDRISVYPMFERLNIAAVSKISHAPLRRLTYLVDSNLGKLARKLRLMGFDVLYDPRMDDEELARVAASENRTILTRDKRLLMRKVVTHGLYVRSSDPHLQLIEILTRLDLRDQIKPFSRCLLCGNLLTPLPAKFAHEHPDIPSCIKLTQDTFYQCEACVKIYWRGHHYDEMQSYIAEVRKECS